MIPITSETCESAWLKAVEHLCEAEGHVDYNVIVEILKPTAHQIADMRARKIVDAFLRHHDVFPLSTIADTIFPAAQYVDYGTRGVYEIYPYEIYPEIVTPNEWGRYAHRLVHWPPGADRAKALNPLERLISKINTQLSSGSPPKRACYEISLTDSSIDLPLYDPAVDSREIMGFPCLSHVSFKLGPDSTLYLTALYRSHYYVARALGNFLGLAALQAFVCEQTHLAPGPLVCVSSYAKLDEHKPKKGPRWGITDARNLVATARHAFDGAVK